MTELEQLEQRVQSLSREDFARLRARILEIDEQLWDQQIAEDLKAGRLDGLVEEALEDFRRRPPRGRQLRRNLAGGVGGDRLRLDDGREAVELLRSD